MEFGVESHQDDWTCNACSYLNYHHRSTCHKCGWGKKSTKILNDGTEDTSHAPTPFLLLRGIDESLSESQLYEQYKEQTSLLKTVWLARDKQTFKSRSFAFLEYSNIAEATNARERINIDFGRDLWALNRLLMAQDGSGQMQYWDPLICLVPFPSSALSETNEEMIARSSTETVVGRTAYNYSQQPLLSRPPPKKIQVQFKKWEASLKDEVPIVSPVVSSFVPSVAAPSTLATPVIFEDVVRRLCLLCFRQFKSVDALQRHTSDSKLHKLNLEEYVRIASSPVPQPDIELKVEMQDDRDRSSLPEDNVGAILMKKMGWKEGEGLGKDAKGIKAPIQPKGLPSKSTTGIGAKHK